MTAVRSPCVPPLRHRRFVPHAKSASANADSLREALSIAAQSLAGAQLSLLSVVQRLHDRGCGEIRLLARRLARRAAYCPLSSFSSRRLRSALMMPMLARLEVCWHFVPALQA